MSAKPEPSIFDALTARPGRFDLFQALRRIEAAHADKPRLGDALRPGDEPVRFASEPALNFAPTAITKLAANDQGPPRLVQRVLSLFGPNGALPTHLTEYARERAMHHGDRTFAAFADMLLHRFGLLFYRAWARANPVVGMDRSRDAPIVRHVGALIGLAEPSLRERDALGDFPKLYFAGRLARSARDADGLQSWIALRFRVPALVQQFSGHWMPLGPEERTRLVKHDGVALGRGAVLGRQVWDVQHKFRIEIGPLGWEAFQAFLPSGPHLPALQAMVRQYVGQEFAWDVRLRLKPAEVPAWPLGKKPGVGMLGRSAWLNSQRPRKRADQLLMNVESICRGPLKASLAPKHQI
ncbi:type VI secretion system baseplate subunit TssG [Roseateles sp. P5_D6]